MVICVLELSGGQCGEVNQMWRCNNNCEGTCGDDDVDQMWSCSYVNPLCHAVWIKCGYCGGANVEASVENWGWLWIKCEDV